MVIVSPWNKRHLVPPFTNESEIVLVVLGQRKSRDLLTSGKAIEAIAAQLLEQLGPRVDKSAFTAEERSTVLAEHAAVLGLNPEAVDQAIRAWGARTQDSYAIGLVALYERDYMKAERKLTASLNSRRRELSQAHAINAAVFPEPGHSTIAQDPRNANFRTEHVEFYRGIQAWGTTAHLRSVGQVILPAGNAEEHFASPLAIQNQKPTELQAMVANAAFFLAGSL